VTQGNVACAFVKLTKVFDNPEGIDDSIACIIGDGISNNSVFVVEGLKNYELIANHELRQELPLRMRLNPPPSDLIGTYGLLLAMANSHVKSYLVYTTEDFDKIRTLLTSGTELTMRRNVKAYASWWNILKIGLPLIIKPLHDWLARKTGEKKAYASYRFTNPKVTPNASMFLESLMQVTGGSMTALDHRQQWVRNEPDLLPFIADLHGRPQPDATPLTVDRHDGSKGLAFMINGGWSITPQEMKSLITLDDVLY